MRSSTIRLLVTASLAASLATAAGCNFTIPGVDLPAGAAPGQPGAPPGGPAMTLPDGGADLTPQPGPSPTPSPSPSPSPGNLGDACDATHPCAQPTTCYTQTGQGGSSTRLPDGLCTLPCGGGCPRGSACVTFDKDAICLPTCDPGTCRSGYECCHHEDKPSTCQPNGSC